MKSSTLTNEFSWSIGLLRAFVQNFKNDYPHALNFDSNLQDLHRIYLDEFDASFKYYDETNLLAKKLFPQFKKEQSLIISDKYETSYFQIDHILTFSELLNILAFTITHDYASLITFKDQTYKYFSLLSLKYQFLFIKVNGIPLIDHLLSKFKKFENNHENCLSNLIATTLIKYLGENPVNLTSLAFIRHLTNLIYLIHPEKPLNGKKIDWPPYFLDLVEKFMTSETCKKYISCIDLIQKKPTSDFFIDLKIDEQELKNHIHLLVHENLKNLTFIFHGSEYRIATNLYNGVIAFNQSKNFTKYFDGMKNNKCYLAYLIIIVVHELLHLKRILFNGEKHYKWSTPNISPFKENMKNDKNEQWAEIGLSFELSVLGFVVNEATTENKELCETILNEELWDDSHEKLKYNCKKFLIQKNQNACEISKIDSDSFYYDKTNCGRHFDVDQYIKDFRRLQEAAKLIPSE